MRLNVANKVKPVYNNEGVRAADHVPNIDQLRRSVLSCMLWENEFYDDGIEIAKRIATLCDKVTPKQIADLAIEARSKFNLRHVPLLLLTQLIRVGSGSRLVSDTIYETIQRADELAELLTIYWAVNGKDKPLANQLKKGLARAFTKFNEYALAKYNRDNAVKLRDVLFLVHPKPIDGEDGQQQRLWNKLVNNELAVPDTWEVALSAGKDKGETFARLIQEEKLGYFALLRNLRNMVQANVPEAIVRKAILARKGGAERILPFRYIAAARHAPMYEKELDVSFQASTAELPKLRGRTIVLVDVSPSMYMANLSSKSDLTRADAAAALAVLVQSDSKRVFAFAEDVKEVPARNGMAGIDAIHKFRANATKLGKAVAYANTLEHDRLIVISDEESQDKVPSPVAKNSYMINVASTKNGIGYKSNGWTAHLDGFSENVIRWIVESETYLD